MKRITLLHIPHGSQPSWNSGNLGIMMGFYMWADFGIKSWNYHGIFIQCHGNQQIFSM